MQIRPFSAQDMGSCLKLLAGNTPEYFVAQDLETFEEFLQKLPGPYFVVVQLGSVVASGGWALDSDNVALLTWGMVRRDLHRQGIGRALLRFRVDNIEESGRVSVVRVHTVQLVQAFFAREGFRVLNTLTDGFGPGFDHVTMERRLDDDFNSTAREASQP